MTDKTTVLVARGIGDPVHTGMLSHVTNNLDPNRFEIREVLYPAEYGPASGFHGRAFGDSLRQLRQLIRHELEQLPRPRSTVLLGYSGGAQGVGDTVAELSRSPIADKIRAVGLLADPGMPLSAAPAGLPVCGITGGRPISTDKFPVWWVSDPRDPIPCLDLNSPLRIAADASYEMSFTDVGAWARNVRIRLRAKQIQQVVLNLRDPFAVAGQFEAAIDAVGRYTGADHTSYQQRLYPGTNRTYTEWLADRINEIQE